MKKSFYLYLPLLAVGLLCALLLLGGRFSAEMRDRDVLAVMSDQDLALLAEVSGVPTRVWREMLAPAEGYLTRPDETSSLPLALMENRARTDILSLESFDPETYPGPMVNALYLYQPEYSRRAAQNDARAVQDLLFRAVTDRGLRLLILTPLRDAEGDLVTDPAVYRDMLEGLGKRLEARGYTFGKTFSPINYRPVFSPDILRLWAGTLPLLLGCWLLLQLIPGLNKWGRWLYPAALLLYVLAANILDARFFLLVQLAGVMVFSCCAAWFVAEYVKKPNEKPLWQTVPVFTSVLIGWSLLGGLWISALMSTRTYLLGCAAFSGVKLSLLFPMVLCFGLLLWNLRKPFWQTGQKSWLALVAVGGILLLLTVRSGDTAGGIPAAETAFRSWLEYTFYARPRTKELLFAIPCVPVFLWACRRKHVPLQLLCGMGVCLECVSAINTFCHAVAPLTVSLARTLLAVGAGLVPGILALLALEGFYRLRTR